MQTHNLKDLRKIKITKEFIGNGRTLYKPLVGRNVQVLEKSDMDIAIEATKRGYRREINHNRKRINATLRPVYGKELPKFAERITSNVVGKIKNIIDAADADFKTIAAEIRQYIGNVRFFRKEGLREVPVDSDRILNAYLSVKRKEPISKVKHILFN